MTPSSDDDLRVCILRDLIEEDDDYAHVVLHDEQGNPAELILLARDPEVVKRLLAALTKLNFAKEV